MFVDVASKDRMGREIARSFYSYHMIIITASATCAGPAVARDSLF